MKYYNLEYTNYTGAWPNLAARNITVPGDGQGTEWIKPFPDEMWGITQHLMTQAGLLPDGVTEANGASQIYEAMQACFSMPGELVPWVGNGSPEAFTRLLILDGTTVTAANYPDLVSRTYIGDANNGNLNYTGFAKTSDSGGTTRNIAGPYFLLPNFYGVFVRGIDPTNIHDPFGSVRDIPMLQHDSFETHGHALNQSAAWYAARTSSADLTGASNGWSASGTPGTNLEAPDNLSDILGGSPDNNETRSVNVNCIWCVRY
jgi:hypothetical protein